MVPWGVDDVLGLLVLLLIFVILAHFVLIFVLTKLKSFQIERETGSSIEVVKPEYDTIQEENNPLPFPSSRRTYPPIESDSLLPKKLLVINPAPHTTEKMIQVRRNNLENGVLFLPNLMTVQVGSLFWKGITGLEYNHSFMLMLVGAYFLGRLVDSYLIYKGKENSSSYLVSFINIVNILFAIFGATGATITLGTNLSSGISADLCFILFSWALSLLMLKTEFLGFVMRKTLRTMRTVLLNEVRDERHREKLARFETAHKSAITSLLPFFVISFCWLTLLKADRSPNPEAFLAVIIVFTLAKFILSFAAIYRANFLRSVLSSVTITLKVFMAAWFIVSSFLHYSNVQAPKPFIFLEPILAILALHQIGVKVFVEVMRFMAKYLWESDDNRQFLSYESVGYLRVDQIDSMEHLLSAIFIILLAIKPVVTLGPTMAGIASFGEGWGWALIVSLSGLFISRAINTILCLQENLRPSFMFGSFIASIGFLAIFYAVSIYHLVGKIAASA